MSAQENIALVKQVYVAFNEGDIGKLLDMYTDDAEWEYPVIEGVRYAGQQVGRNQIAEFFRGIAVTSDVLEFEQSAFIAQGNKVAVCFRYKARIKTTGNILETDGVHVFTIGDGKIQSAATHLDTAAAMAAHRQGEVAGA